MMMKLALLSVFVFAAFAANKSIWETAIGNADLTSLVKAVENNTAVVALLNSTTQNLTLFAPKNSAFEKNHSKLAPTYHVHVGDIIMSTQIADGLTFLDTAFNVPLEISKSATGVSIIFGLPRSVSVVTTPDVKCAGGVVHIIDTVLDAPATTLKTAQEANLTALIDALADAKIDINTANITVFAPDNAAFENSGFTEMNTEAKGQTLKYHIVQGLVYSTDLKDGVELTTLIGDKLLVKVTGDVVTVGGASIKLANVLTTAVAVVHVVSDVLFVPNNPARGVVANLALDPVTTTLAAVLNTPAFSAVKDTLVGANNATLFAPTNEAFAAAAVNTSDVAAVTAVLQYHVLGVAVYAGDLAALQFVPTLLTDPKYVNLANGAPQVVKVAKGESGVTVNEASVVMADLRNAKGTVVHVVNQVLAIPANIVAVATAAKLTILLEQVVRTGLVEAVQGKSLTILAPEDKAFTNFNANVSEVPIEAVKSLLLNHVFQGDLFSLIVANATKITSLGNKTYDVTVVDGVVMIDDAKVIVADQLTMNGVVHVLDRVLGGPGPAPASSSGVSAGAVVGIVIGVLAGVALVGYCCFKSSEEEGYKPM